MSDISIKVDTSEFKKVFAEYMTLSKRNVDESVNTHAYFIARDAVSTTPSSSKDKIRQELSADSEKYSGVPLAAVLINKQLKIKGKKGLSGAKMATAIEKFLNKRANTVNYFRAGWLTAMRAIQPYTAKKGGKAIPAGVRIRTKGLGGAQPAPVSKTNWNPIASIWNSVNIHNELGMDFLEIGAQKAIELEINSMRQYIEKKQAELCSKFWS